MHMYVLKVSKSPSFDESEEIYQSDLEDIVNSIEALIPDVEEFSVKRSGGAFKFDSSLSENEIKKALKDVFSHHIENVRFVSLQRVHN